MQVDILADNIPLCNLGLLEKRWIAKLDTLHPKGYNMTPGGDSNPMDKADIKAKQKINVREVQRTWEYRKNRLERLRSNESGRRCP